MDWNWQTHTNDSSTMMEFQNRQTTGLTSTRLNLETLADQKYDIAVLIVFF